MGINNKDKLIEHYVTEKINDRPLSEIRKELLSKGIHEQEVLDIIQKIDEKVLQYELNKTKAKINKQILYLGIVLLLIGFIIFFLGKTKTVFISKYLAISTTMFFVGVIMVVFSLVFSQQVTQRNK